MTYRATSSALLLPVRAVFRADDRKAAERFAAFIGVDPSEDIMSLLTDVNRLGQGQCLYRDVRGRIGVVQVLPAWSDGLARAMESNPRRVSEQSPVSEHSPGPLGAARLAGKEPELSAEPASSVQTGAIRAVPALGAAPAPAPVDLRRRPGRPQATSAE